MIRKISLRLILQITSLAILCSCSGPHWTKTPLSPSTSLESSSSNAAGSKSSYDWNRNITSDIRPGYLIGLNSGDPKVNGEFRVEIDGTLKLPYNVQVKTSGVDEKLLQSEINSAYRGYFRSADEVKVSILKRERLLDVQGLVEKPGQYPFRQNASLDEVIAQAGGLQENLENKVQYVRIEGDNQSAIIRLADYHSGIKSMTPSWQGGESLFFQTEGVNFSDNSNSNSIVRILGEVKNPAEYSIDPNSNFFTYLVKAGGPTDRADLGNVTLLRSSKTESSTISFNTQSSDEIPAIKPGDTIIVNADNASQFEKKSRIGANIANIITSIGIIIIAAM